MPIDKDSFYELLCKTLDPRSGKILPIDKTNESGWRKVLDIEWKGGIHFMVESSKYCWGYSHVMRDGQDLSPSYCITKPDDDSIKCMQHIIDDIEDGKYRNKKTLREKIKLFKPHIFKYLQYSDSVVNIGFVDHNSKRKA